MNRDTLAFFGLAYLFSWCAFIPLALSAQGLIPSAPSWLHLAGSFGPLLAVVLWHGSYNAAVAGAGPLTSATITAAVILAVIMIGRRYGPESLSIRPAQKKLS